MAKKFEWDDSALIPDEFTVTFHKGTDKEEKVTFYELPRPDLTEFLAKATERKFVDEEGNRTPVADVMNEQALFLFEYLAKATRGKKDAAWFEAQEIPVKGLAALTDGFLALCHTDDILAVGGNWLTLPMVWNATSDKEETKSPSQQPIIQA